MHHAHVVDVTDVGVYDDTPVLVMELLEGESLAARIARDGPLDAVALIDLALPVMDALGTAHAEGIIHRDLKPENIFLRKTRGRGLHPVLVDFGISKIEGGDARLTKTASFMGTPNYMSPEQARGSKEVEPRSDQYSLGLVLYEAATGQRAIEGDSVLEIAHKISTDAVRKLGDAGTSLSPALCRTVDRMLSLRASDRFPTLVDAGAALLPLASSRTAAVWGSAFGADGGSIRPPPAPPGPTAVPVDTDTRTPYTTPTGSGARARTGLRILGGVLGVAALALGGITFATWPATSPAPGPPTTTTTTTTTDRAPVDVEAPSPERPPPEPAHGLDIPPEPIEREGAPEAVLEPDGGAQLEVRATAATTPPPPPSSHVHTPPATPTRGQIREAVDRIAPVARACGRILHGQVTVSFTVRGATGRVSEIEVQGPRPSPPLEQCITRAFAAAQFHTFTQPTFRVRYPMTI
ncbi:MAG: serine/threonine-protein kinase [Sandaracinus sp.]